MKEVYLKEAAIQWAGDRPFIDIDTIKVSEIKHRYIFHQINWHKLVALIDMQGRSKKYATLVIEDPMNFYLLPDTTTSIINQQLRQEPRLSPCYNLGIAQVLQLRNKYPIITSHASLAPLQKSTKSRTYSWFNMDNVDYCQLQGFPKATFLQTGNHNLLLKTSSSAFYMNNKMEDIQKMANYIIDDSRRYNIVSERLSRYVNTHPKMLVTNYVNVTLDTIQDVTRLAAKYLYENWFKK
jgi:hypothetical protein